MKIFLTIFLTSIIVIILMLFLNGATLNDKETKPKNIGNKKTKL